MKISFEDALFLFEEMVADTGLPIPFDAMRNAVEDCRVIIRYDNSGEPAGFITWMQGADPDTGEEMWVERLLWVRPSARGTMAAARLLQAWQRRAEDYGVHLLFGGATLPNPDVAKRLYESAGFETKYTFKKRIR